MINIYFAKPSRSVDIVNSVVKMTHIKVNDYTQETKTVANISQTVAKMSQIRCSL
jgi:hypothetical protein